MLNTEQMQVVNHTYGPAAVLSGAGSGKTSTLIGRIQVLADMVDPKRIVMLTFTNDAANEMKFRAAKVNEKCKEVYASTYHKYCGMLLRRYGKAIGILPGFEILTAQKYETFIEYIKSSSEYYESLENFPSASKLGNIFSVITNTDITVESLIYNTKYSNYASEIKQLYKEVKKAGLDQQKLNFDDMLVYTNELLNDNDICKKIAESFDFLMVDEFQDTNDLQLNILLKLSRYNNNIVVVGDISQSIYKFRGAKVENIQKFIDTFINCEVYTLSTNFRSTQEILDATNAMMNNYVKSWTYTDMIANNKHGDKPIIKRHRDDRDQAEWIINQINHLNVNCHQDYSDIVIIERKSMSSFKLEAELAKANIPFTKHGGRKFTEYAVVNDILTFLTLTTKNADKFSWFTILKLIPGIGSKAAISISDVCNEDRFWDKFAKKKYSEDLNELVSKIIEYKTLTDNLLELLDKISEYYFALRTAKIENSAKMSSSAKFDAMEKIKRDQEIYEILKNMASNYNKVSDFLDDLALDSIKKTNDENGITITTIHSAKGLEWPTAILLDFWEYDMPDEEEELRCWYVAMTRAEENLYISIPKFIMVNSQPMYNDSSHFIHGLEQTYFNEV